MCVCVVCTDVSRAFCTQAWSVVDELCMRHTGTVDMRDRCTEGLIAFCKEGYVCAHIDVETTGLPPVLFFYRCHPSSF